MKSAEERLLHDVQAAIEHEVADRLRNSQLDIARALVESRWLAGTIIEQLRIRWTIIERPRKQTTLRQEA